MTLGLKKPFLAIQRPNQTQTYGVFTKGMELFSFIYVHFFDIAVWFFFSKGNLQNHLLTKWVKLGSEKVVVIVISGSATHREVTLLHKIAFLCFTI